MYPFFSRSSLANKEASAIGRLLAEKLSFANHKTAYPAIPAGADSPYMEPTAPVLPLPAKTVGY